MKTLKIGDLTAKYPIIQGGMGVGISLHSLAGAVAKAGGIGIISTAQIGFKDPEFLKAPMEANLRAIGEELKKAREIAPKGIIGFNIMVATRNYAQYVKEAVKAGADIIISGAGLPVSLPELVEGAKTKIAPIVSTAKSALVICKMWDRKYKRIPDLLVIEGPLAGGHLGFSREELTHLYEPDYEANYDDEIRRIIACVHEYGEKYGVHIPVITAGGIMNARQVQHAFALGAEGVQVATPFVTTEECDAAPAYKQAYVNAKKEDIEIVTSPVGMPGRAIHNAFLEKVAQQKEHITHCFRCLEKCNPTQAPYCITQALIRAVEGDVENGLIFCGDNVQYLDHIGTVEEVVHALFPES